MKIYQKIYSALLICMLSLLLFSCSSDDNSSEDNNDNQNPNNAWTKLGGAIFSDRIQDIVSDSQGNIYVAGRFKNSQGKYYVAKWDGSNWSQLGDINVTNEILCLSIDSNNNIYAGGRFNNIKKWNGSVWIELNNNAFITANTWILRLDSQNNLYAGTGGYVYKWNGNNWSAIGNLWFDGSILAMDFDSQNNLYVGGDFTSGGKNIIKKWNGSTWTTLPIFDHQYSGSITAIKFDNSDNMYVAGDFNLTLNQLYMPKWNGTNWSTSFNGFNTTVHFRNGKTFVAGTQNQSGGLIKLYQLNNQNWSDVGSLYVNGTIYKIWYHNNSVYVVGWFTDGATYLQGNNYVAKYNL